MKTRDDILKEMGELKRDADYWEAQYKALTVQYAKRVEDINKLQTQVELWRGTGL
tara:strand:+ start:893 stop:1057 length:165 start_codon:yes stop_codon:yes gene_type:complete